MKVLINKLLYFFLNNLTVQRDVVERLYGTAGLRYVESGPQSRLILACAGSKAGVQYQNTLFLYDKGHPEVSFLCH